MSTRSYHATKSTAVVTVVVATLGVVSWQSLPPRLRERIRVAVKGGLNEVGATIRRLSSTAVVPLLSMEKNTAGRIEPADEISEIATQQAYIQGVLCYWFGQYTPAEAQKKLWMISAQATEYRKRIDADIYQRFAHLFSTTTSWQNWCQQPQFYGIHGKVAAIVLLDQFGRHMHRLLTEQQKQQQRQLGVINAIAPQTVLDERALHVAQSVVTQHAAELSLLAPAVQIFTYMPFRHANQLKTVQQVQAQIQQWTELHQQHADLLSRFRKATHRRLAVLQDEARRKGTAKKEASRTPQTDMSSNYVFTHSDILEALPFEVDDMTPATQHVVYQTILKFLQTQMTVISPQKALSDSAKEYPIIVSLSGGVDSMVISAVLAHLSRQKISTLPTRVIALHIDYANRPESAAEADFCRQWCESHGIDFDVRRIDHVTRGVTARDEYERVSRQVRYDFYRDTIQRVGGGENCGVVLGHHRGDLRENVLSNAHKGSGPLDLSGMTAVSRNDGVTIYRPLLPLEKTAIFDYAHAFGVPYFKDTTPHWSTRGKLRNRLLPLLEEIYGEGCLNNLSNLAVESDECRALLQKVLFQPFMDEIQRTPMGMILSTAPWKDQGLFFWKFVLRESLHSGGFGMFSDKAVVSFLERLHARRQGWLQCRKDYAVYLQQDGHVFVLKPHSFPWRKMDQYDTEGRTIDYGAESAATIGPWRVTALLVDPLVSNGKDLDSLLHNKAVESMAHLMKGSVEYYIQVPTWPREGSKEDGNDGVEFDPRPLVFRKFTKSSRPLAWKSIDTRVQDTLPLVGNDVTSLAALQDPLSVGAVYVDQASGHVVVPTPVRLVRVSICLQSDEMDPKYVG